MRNYLTVFLLITLTTFTSIKAAPNYIVQPQDTLEIRVTGHDDLTIKQEVTPDHTLSVPLIGDRPSIPILFWEEEVKYDQIFLRDRGNTFHRRESP